MSTNLKTERTDEESMSEEQLEKKAEGTRLKEEADKLFKEGEIQKALLKYHSALTYLRGINRNQSTAGVMTGENQDKPKSEVDILLGKIYANQSACHYKKGNWKRVIETADEALKIDKDNNKVKFRKASARGESGFTEDAIAQLEKLLKDDPTNASSIQAELNKIRVKDNARQKVADKQFKGFLSREKPASSSKTAQSSTKPEKEEESKDGYRPISPPPPASIEEVKDD